MEVETDSSHLNATLTPVSGEGTSNQAIRYGTENDGIINTTNPVPHTLDNVVVDIYTLDESGKPRKADTSSPFQMVARLCGPQGECVRFLAMVDNGTMINAIDMEAHSRITKRLSPLQQSNWTLHMADGSLVPSSGLWTGTFEWGPVCVETTCEVFPSGGSWQMLVGKPLLEQTHAIKAYKTDTILLPEEDKYICVENYKPPWTISPPTVHSALFSPGHTQDNVHLGLPVPSLLAGTVFPLGVERLEEQTRPTITEGDTYTSTNIQTHLPLGYSLARSFASLNRTTRSLVAHVGEGERREMDSQEGSGELTDMVEGCSNVEVEGTERLFTRLTEEGPFHPPRVKKILELV